MFVLSDFLVFFKGANLLLFFDIKAVIGLKIAKFTIYLPTKKSLSAREVLNILPQKILFYQNINSFCTCRLTLLLNSVKFSALIIKA